MRALGFGLERVSLAALAWPRIAAAVFLVILALAGFGITRLSFDENLRDTFASDSRAFQDYVAATADFVDPENETLILVEGANLGTPANFKRLQDLQFELQLLDGVDTVFSPFALREPPAANGDAALTVADISGGLTPALATRIRAHPILGAKLLAADGKAMIFIVTPTEQKASLAVARQLSGGISDAIATVFAGSDLAVTVSGFPAVRADIADIIKRDQLVLNAAGAAIGFVMSLLIFRSLIAAIMAAAPAIVGGLVVVGAMGLFGVPVTVMSTVVPALVMIFGYTDGMHLCFAWQHHRNAGRSVAEAEKLAQQEVGGACMLAAITTAIAFASLILSQVVMVRSFGLIGALGTVGGGMVVLVVHVFVTLLIGRLWKARPGAKTTFLGWMEEPCAAIGRFAVGLGKPISALAVILLFVLGAGHLAAPPQHSLREHLPANNVANAALGRIDAAFGGIYPIQIVVPLKGAAPGSPEAIARIRAIHEAVASAVANGAQPLSLWSLAAWLGGSGTAEARRIDEVLASLTDVGRTRFLDGKGNALVTANVPEMPSHQARELVGRIAAAARAAGGPDVVVTGVTVVNGSEGARTIGNLNLSLLLAVVCNLAVIALAFRSIPIGILSFLPNMLPILATGTMLYLSGRGMQFTSVIALNVAFGIAVDDTVHFINRFLHLPDASGPLDARLVQTSRRIGPVLTGTTLIIIAGLSTTLTSGLPTITLFGFIAALTLIVGLIGDLVVLPALMAGPGRRWFAAPRQLVAREAPA